MGTVESMNLNKQLHVFETLDIVCEDDKYLPAYANSTDACMDLKVKIDNRDGATYLNKGCEQTFGTGVYVAVPKGFVMLIFIRSSMGIKYDIELKNKVGVIDSGYRGEIKLGLRNFSKEKDILLHDGDRVAQFLLLPIPHIHLNEVDMDDDFLNGDRGGGIGSTGI